jgi:hypothetical protein
VYRFECFLIRKDANFLFKLPPFLPIYQARCRMFDLHFSIFHRTTSDTETFTSIICHRENLHRQTLSACSDEILRLRVNYAPLVHLSYPEGSPLLRLESGKLFLLCCSPLHEARRTQFCWEKTFPSLFPFAFNSERLWPSLSPRIPSTSVVREVWQMKSYKLQEVATL